MIRKKYKENNNQIIKHDKSASILSIYNSNSNNENKERIDHKTFALDADLIRFRQKLKEINHKE